MAHQLVPKNSLLNLAAQGCAAPFLSRKFRKFNMPLSQLIEYFNVRYHEKPLLHNLSSQVLIQRVEEEGFASLARDAGATLAQGYYFGMPQAHTDADAVEEKPIRILTANQVRPSSPQ
jgi:hypothetical protein